MRMSYRHIHFSPTASVVEFPPKTMEELLKLANETESDEVILITGEERSTMSGEQFSLYIERRRELDHYDVTETLFSIIRSPITRAVCVLWLTSPTSTEDEIIHIEVTEPRTTPIKKSSVLDFLSPRSLPTTPVHTPPPDDVVSITSSSAVSTVTQQKSVHDVTIDEIIADPGDDISSYVSNEIMSREWDGTWRVIWKSGKGKLPGTFRISVKFAKDVYECYLVIVKDKADEHRVNSQLRLKNAITKRSGLENWQNTDGTMKWFTHVITPPSSSFDTKKLPGLTERDCHHFKIIGDLIVARMAVMYDTTH